MLKKFINWRIKKLKSKLIKFEIKSLKWEMKKLNKSPYKYDDAEQNMMFHIDNRIKELQGKPPVKELNTNFQWDEFDDFEKEKK